MRHDDHTVRSGAGFASMVAVCVVLFVGTAAQAADHAEPPAVSNMKAADIADFYAWHDGGNLVVALTFAGPVEPAADQSPTLHRDVLYGIHVDNNDDQKAETDIWIRFAEDSNGNWGVRLDNVPGAGGPVTGAVGSQLTPSADAKAWVGLREDPFFFDLEGFQNSVQNQSLTGSNGLYFDDSRDFYAGKNVTAVVLEFPLSEVLGSGDVLDLWVSTSLYDGGGA